jgi:hypothetical protein
MNGPGPLRHRGLCRVRRSRSLTAAAMATAMRWANSVTVTSVASRLGLPASAVSRLAARSQLPPLMCLWMRPGQRKCHVQTTLRQW